MILSWIQYQYFIVPETDDAKKWTCYFQNFPNGLTIDFGTSDFCGASHYYPDCDPQVNFDPLPWECTLTFHYFRRHPTLNFSSQRPLWEQFL